MVIQSYIDVSVKDQLSGFSNEKISGYDLVSESLRRISAHDVNIHAFLHTLNDVSQMDETVISGTQPSIRTPLYGIPVAVKDTICTSDMPTTCGSRMLKGYQSPFEAEVITRLKNAGAVILGKTNTDEFGMGSTTEFSYFGPTCNPYDNKKVAGGSSGGSAAAVASGMVGLALGSDTGGSIRQPAAFCGIVGLKPTYGRVSRRGLIAFASSLDQIGPMARSVDDCRILFRAMVGYDPMDSTSFAMPAIHVHRLAELTGLRLGIVRDLSDSDMDSDVAMIYKRSIDHLSNNGAQIVEVSLPHLSSAIAAYYLVACAEAASNLSRFDGLRFGYHSMEGSLGTSVSTTRSTGFGAEVKRRIILGTFALREGYRNAYYIRAKKIQRLIARDFSETWKSCDMIMTPTTPTTAFSLGSMIDDPLELYRSDRFTVPANLAGIPALSVPGGLSSKGMPVGIQFMAPHLWEELLFDVGKIFEKLRGPLPLPSGFGELS